MQETTPNSLSSQDLPFTQLAQSDSEGSEAKSAVRCKQRTRTGRPCQLRVLDTSSGLCFRHAGLRERQNDPDDLSADLLDKYDVNDFLARLLFLLVRNRISAKRTGVLTYIAAQILRSLREARHVEHADEEPVNIIVDMPRPDRSGNEDNSPAIQRT